MEYVRGAVVLIVKLARFAAAAPTKAKVITSLASLCCLHSTHARALITHVKCNFHAGIGVFRQCVNGVWPALFDVFF
jgi:hypothetical protein